MTIHKEGRASIIITFLFIIILGYNTFLMFPEEYYQYSFILYGIYILFFIFILHFFRYPNRTVNKNEEAVIAPADGKVVVVEEIVDEEYFKDKRIQVSIFMSPLNVHANWYPISGDVVYTQYHPGKHMVASHPKSSTLNERTSVVVRHENGKEVLFKQVAGTVARRVVCYSKTGDKAVQGDNYGFIKFGSRVDIILPLDAKINVKLGQKTTGLKTVIANL